MSTYQCDVCHAIRPGPPPRPTHAPRPCMNCALHRDDGQQVGYLRLVTVGEVEQSAIRAGRLAPVNVAEVQAERDRHREETVARTELHTELARVQAMEMAADPILHHDAIRNALVRRLSDHINRSNLTPEDMVRISNTLDDRTSDMFAEYLRRFSGMSLSALMPGFAPGELHVGAAEYMGDHMTRLGPVTGPQVRNPGTFPPPPETEEPASPTAPDPARVKRRLLL